MARINIEDSLFKDSRFLKLCVVLGSSRTAIGAVVEAWILAQEQVTILNPKGLVPIEKWNEHDICNDIISCKLALVKDEYVEIVGAEKNFSWLVQKKSAGSKGGLNKAENAKRSSSNATATLSEGYPPTPTLPPVINNRDSTNNSTTKFQAQMTENTLSYEFRQYFRKDKRFYFLKHHLEKVVDRFDSIDEFQGFCENVINSKKGLKVPESDVFVYVIGALKKELGIS